MRLSIVIVSWNTRSILQDCLASVYANPPQGDFEIWVVDNASSDGSPEMIQTQFPTVRLIENPANSGFGAANNLALQRCNGQFILLLNPDTLVYPQALERLVSFMEQTPDCGGAGSKLINPDGSLQAGCYPAPTLGRELWRLFYLDKLRSYGVYDMNAWDQGQSRPVDVLQGACLLVRAEALSKVGLFDEDFFMYSEEVDLCYRLRQAGWKLYWVPQAEVVHLGGQSTQQVATDMFLHLYRSKLLYFRKHLGLSRVLLYKLVLFLAGAARLVGAPLTLLEPATRRAKRRQLLENYWRLILALPRM